jgi:cytoskeletal protein CcmA (bactofilin family)
MKRTMQILLFLILLLTLAPVDIAMAQTIRGDEIVTGGTFTLRSGETLDGDLIVFGGIANLLEDSRVTGDVVLFGGTVNVNGLVDGSVVAIGGVIYLQSQSWVRRDVTIIGGSIQQQQGSRVDGDLIRGFRGFPVRVFPFGRVIVPQVPEFTSFRVMPGWEILWFFFRTFLWAALAVLVVLFIPDPTSRVANTAVGQPLLSGGVGLLTGLIAPIILIAITITIILIPVSLLGAFLLAVAWFFGRIGLGLVIGRRLAGVFNQDWPLAVTTGIGTFALVLVVDGAREVIPCLGWVFAILVGMIGLGAVILSRFGTQTYPPARPLPAGEGMPPEYPPPAPPPPPEDRAGETTILPPEDRID